MMFRTGSWSAQLSPQAAHPTSDSPSPSRAQVLFSAAPKLQLPRARPTWGGPGACRRTSDWHRQS